MKIGVIYKITNPNGKIYVGQTINYKNRIRKYQSADCVKQRIIYNSIKKYSWSAHTIVILEEIICDVDKTVLNDREKYWIKELKSFGFGGMNCNQGGHGNLGRVCSEETKEKIRQGNLGKKVSAEAKRRIGLARLGKRCTRSEETKKRIGDSKRGHIVTEETRQKISKFNKGKVTPEATKEKMRLKQLGKKHTQESKNNISKNKKGKPWSEARRLAYKARYEGL